MHSPCVDPQELIIVFTKRTNVMPWDVHPIMSETSDGLFENSNSLLDVVLDSFFVSHTTFRNVSHKVTNNSLAS